MKLHFNCPACERKIGLFTIMMALTPFFFTCLKCKSKIKVSGVFWHIFAEAMIIGVLMVFYLFHSANQFGKFTPSNLLYAFCFLLLIEFIAAIFVCNKGEIIVTKNKFKGGD